MFHRGTSVAFLITADKSPHHVYFFRFTDVGDAVVQGMSVEMNYSLAVRRI